MITFSANQAIWPNGMPVVVSAMIESTTTELASLQTGALRGCCKNSCFVPINLSFPNRRVRGWYNIDTNLMEGIIHIECTPSEAETIQQIVCRNRGSLVTFGPSLWAGFYTFETK